MKYLLLISAVVLGIFFLASLKPSQEIISPLPVDRELEYKNNFIDACVKESGMNDTCTCLYTYIVDRYSWEERMELDKLVQNGEEPHAVNDAILYCTGSYVQ